MCVGGGWAGRCCEEKASEPESSMSAEVDQRGARLKTGWWQRPKVIRGEATGLLNLRPRVRAQGREFRTHYVVQAAAKGWSGGAAL